MLFKVDNKVLIRDRERTYLTASASASTTANQTLTVQAVDSNAWSDDDYIIIGEIGTKTAEIMRISATVSDGTSLTVSRSTTSGADTNGLRFNHSTNEPIYRIDFNQIEIRHSSTDDSGASTATATIEIQPDDLFTRYEDIVHGSGFGFVRFKNEESGLFSAYSDGIPLTGQSAKSLAKLIGKVRQLLNEPTQDYIEDTTIIDALNDKQRDISHVRMWSFYEVERSFSSVSNQFAYDLPSTVKDGTIFSVSFDTQPLEKMDRNQWNLSHWDTDQSNQDPQYANIWNNQIKVGPRPSSDADTTMLDGGITATATTITVDDTSSFNRGDYYRFIIGNEVIYATGSTSTTFTGCLRAQEGTTAAAHSDDATVTERDIVYTSQVEPTDLFDLNDETAIPDPLVLALGAAADLALGHLQNETLHDRLLLRYEEGIEDLKDKYSIKFTGQFTPVRAYESTISGLINLRDPNLYPRDLG